MPNLFNKLFIKKEYWPENAENRNSGGGDFLGQLNFSIGSNYANTKAMKLSAVYRAVDLISNTVASLPIDVFNVTSDGYKRVSDNTQLRYILNSEANQELDAFTFKKLMVSLMLLQGNAYAYIDRDRKGNVKGLYLIPNGLMTVIEPTKIKDNVKYAIAGIGSIDSSNVLHIKNFTNNGYIGLSTISYAAQTLGLAYDAENYATNFYQGAISGIISTNTPLTAKQKEQIKTSWRTSFGSGNNAGSVAVLEGGFSYQPITVNPSDASLLDTRKFQIEEIARFFNVPPSKLFYYSGASYNSIEASNLDFLTSCIQPILAKIEAEFERKLFLPSERPTSDLVFNTNELLRTNKTEMAQYYQTLLTSGTYTINEVRRELNLEPVDGGEIPYVQVNMMRLDNAAKNVPSNNAIDNPDKE